MRRLKQIAGGLLVVLIADLCFATTSSTHAVEIIPVEVFQVHQLPVTVSTVELVQVGRGYQLRCSITNNSEEKLFGFRYSLVAIDSDNVIKSLVNRSEAVALAAYTTKRKTFRTSVNISAKYVRVIFMLEQIVGRESIWEVVKAKDALQAYASGDFSVAPSVWRVPNHVDVSPDPRVIYYSKPKRD